MTNTSFLGGAQNKSVALRAIVISTGLPKTDLAYNTATIVGSYWRGGMGTPPSATAFTLATQTVSGAHSDGGLVHVANGVYRFDLPDAAIATGADWVAFAFSGVADTFITGCHIDIVGADPRSSAAISADVVSISGDTTAADNAEAFFDGTGYAGTGNVIPTVTTATAVTTVNGLAANVITAASLATDAGTELADAFLNRDMSTGTDSGSTTVRTVRQALRALRNKWSWTGGTATVTKEDDSTASWTATVTGTPAITAVDPAGP